MTIRASVSHLLDKRLVERPSTLLLTGIFWSSLAVCVLASLAYEIVYWFSGS